jgi:hypothetical protein
MRIDGLRGALFLLIVSLLSALLLAPGCVQKTGSYYTTEGNITPIAVYDENSIPICKLGVCVCMSCKNSTFSWLRPFPSLVGGNCYFLQNCTPDKFLALMNRTLKPDESARRFMIGQGYSFNDFGDANPWCGNRLDMAVQWLVGDNDTPYSLPDATRAMCMLDKGVMPVYVLYSNGTNIDPDRAKQIATILGTGGKPQTIAGAIIPPGGIIPTTGGPVGPVVITTEMGYDGTNDAVVSNVTQEIINMDQACGNVRTGNPATDKIYCMIALAPKMGDMAAIQAVKDKLGPFNWNKVDLIAFGINAHTVNLSTTNSLTCFPDEALSQAVTFAGDVLYNYSKPTIIPYVMFDANGTDSANSCNWTEQAMMTGYLHMFSWGMIPFQKAGVIGVAAYDFNSSQYSITNPLNCQDCALGKDDYRMANYFVPCRKTKVRDTGQVPSGDNAILFPNESGGSCDLNIQPLGLMQIVYGDSANAISPTTAAVKNETAFRCDACASENLTFPFIIGTRGGAHISLADTTDNNFYCKSIPQLALFAGRKNVDPTIMRAIAIGESGLNPCAAAMVCPDDSPQQAGCMHEGYSKALDYVPEPDTDNNCNPGQPGLPLTNAQNMQFWKPPPMYNSGGKQQAQYRWSGLGLMGVIEPPYTFWPKPYYVNPQNGQTGTDGPLFDGTPTGNQLLAQAQAAGDTANIAGAKSECGDQFNPFNATYASCMGTYKYSVNLKAARDYLGVAGNADALNVKDQPDKLNALAYYIALEMYRGYWYAPYTSIGGGFGMPRKQTYGEQWVAEFKIQQQYTAAWFRDPANANNKQIIDDQAANPECYGQSDFIFFVRECEFKRRNKAPVPISDESIYNNPAAYYGDYGSRILNIYQDLINGCDNSYCPSWKRLAVEMCVKGPLGGVPDVTTGDRCVLKQDGT